MTHSLIIITLNSMSVLMLKVVSSFEINLKSDHRCFRLKRAIFPTIPQSQTKQIG